MNRSFIICCIFYEQIPFVFLLFILFLFFKVRESGLILLQTVPTHIQVKDIKEKLEQVSFWENFFFHFLLMYFIMKSNFDQTDIFVHLVVEITRFNFQLLYFCISCFISHYPLLLPSPILLTLFNHSCCLSILVFLICYLN